MQKSKGKNKGITLIALIITIIVMLILVGVTINVALNGGLFERVKTAAQATEKQEIIEQMIGLIEWDNKGKIKISETVAKIKQKFGESNVTTNPDSVTENTTEVTITVKGKHGSYSYKLTTTELKTLGKSEDSGDDNSNINAYSNENVWETDGNGTILAYLGTEQTIELSRLNDEMENGNYSVEVAKIFGDKQKLVEQWVKDYKINEDINNDPYSYAPVLLRIIEGETIDSEYEPYQESILAYLQGNGERPSGLPMVLEEELEYYEFTLKFEDVDNEIDILRETFSDHLVIPSEYNGENITTVGDGINNFRFAMGCYPTSIVFDEGIEKINSKAFYNWTANFKLPQSIQKVGKQAFYIDTANLGYTRIEGIEYISEKIGEGAFENCGFEGELKVNALEIADRAFYYQKILFGEEFEMTRLIVGKNVNSIGYGAFFGLNMKQIVFEEGVRLGSIGMIAFGRCTNLSDVEIPSTVTTLGPRVFWDCYDISVYVPYASEDKIPSGWSEGWDHVTNDDVEPVVKVKVVYEEQ